MSLSESSLAGPGHFAYSPLIFSVEFSHLFLWKFYTFSVESQLQSKRFRWLGHSLRMPDDRLSKKVLFGQVKGCRPLGRPRLSFNDVTLHQVTEYCITRPYKDAQNRLL